MLRLRVPCNLYTWYSFCCFKLLLRPLHTYIPTHNLLSINQTRRFLSSEAPKPSGASIFQRITSFAVGAGFTALATQYYIFEEIRDGNQAMLAKQQELEKRLLKLEKK